MAPRTIRIEKTKYDGTVQRFCDGQLLDHVGSMLRVKVPAGTPAYVTREDRWVKSGDTALHCYFENRWYNVWHLREHIVAPNLWYANVAMPARFDGATIRWVDLDIDIRCHLDGSLEVLDEDEFAQHRVELGYSDEVVERALAARDEMLQLARAGAFPFDHETQIGALR